MTERPPRDTSASAQLAYWRERLRYALTDQERAQIEGFIAFWERMTR